MKTLTKTQDIQRTRREIEDAFARKERTEYKKLPDNHTGNTGERHILSDDAGVAAIIKTRDGWKIVQFSEYESTLPGNSEGRNGEIRVLSNDTYNAVIYKSDDVWRLLDATVISLVGAAAISSAARMNNTLLATGGFAPSDEHTIVSVATGGILQR